VTNQFIQTAEAPEMASRLNSILTVDEDEIVSLALAGGGDGHTFVVSVETADGEAGALTGELNLIGCYLGASQEELAVAKAAMMTAMSATTPPNPGDTLSIIDEQLAGAAKGTRFMGLLVAEWVGGG
jgi:hypothetical protein